MGKHKSKKHHKKYGDDEERSHKSRSLDSGDKPLKLVLKVGGGKETIVNKEKKPKVKDHSKKKKKKRDKEDKERRKHKLDIASSSCASPASMSSHDKSKKKRDRMEMEGDDALMGMERPIKKIHIKPIEPPPRPIPEPKPKAKKKPKADPTALQLCLENLLTIIQRKDVQGFFAFPVNDAIAPGYSRVIDKPMDFSTIRNKIDSGQYTTIEAFRDDFHLMCNNATVYNAPDTIYYKAAKRLVLIGDKMMTQDKIRNMYRSMGMRMSEIETVTKDLSDEPIDVDTIDSDHHPIIPVHMTKKKPKTKASKSDTRPSVVGRKILAQVQEAAKRVSAQLKEKYPNSKIGFLRRDKDGSTSLAFVNPDRAKESLPVNLGATAGKVTTGSQVTTGFKEEKKNKATPVSYLMYGSFGSFAPTYDSSRATITKEESDLLLSTYGNDAGVHYAQSIQEFVRDTSSFAHGVVDKLLDVLTDGAHSVYTNKMREKSKVIEEVKLDDKKSTDSTDKGTATPQQQQAKTEGSANETKDKTDVSKSADVPIDFKSLLSLSEVGIDVSFLKDIADGKDSSQKQQSGLTLMDQLNSTSRLLEDLQEAQNTRLSSRPGDALSSTPDTATKPSDKEQSIADRLTDTLKSITSQVGPGAVSEMESLRAAMGIGPVSVTSRDVDVKNQQANKDSS